ncbi:hypothetical protein AB205_0210170 [Aquarana catesbeiana]|uniref:Eukaryotic translation initiation factor 4E type 2 n=1 Tax=Aquarana catesbeiana TaxID=8400 RepID=A0A2G9RS13_AQUCT|nr:hypothetical protein AB205_0210170 [Aquarana catesbeiana]
MLGEQFMVGEEICGAVVSVRFQEDIISIWNKTASDQATTARIRDTLRRVLNLPPNTVMEYKTHTDSIKRCLLYLDGIPFHSLTVFSLQGQNKLPEHENCFVSHSDLLSYVKTHQSHL